MPELAEIFRRYGPEYREKYDNTMLPSHRRAMIDIEACRTEAFGGQLYECNKCGKHHYAYHSCKNRHCSKCQNDSADSWLQQQRSLLLPVNYFLVTYTLPEELRNVTRSNQKTVYDSLFRTSAAALQKLVLDPKYVGGKIGMTGVLQTWTRDMLFHPHIHYIVPGGGLHPDGQTWMPAKYPNFLVHTKPLAIIFKEKIRQEMIKNKLVDRIDPRVWSKEWVVDCKAVGTGEQALKYLAPYIFRVAISNNRILNIEDGNVKFLVKNSETGKSKAQTLTAEEFIRRFLQHVLPKGFRKVRYYGLLHPVNRQQLQHIKPPLQNTAANDKSKSNDSTSSSEAKNEQKSCTRCRRCGGELIWIQRLLPGTRAPP